MGSGKSRFTIMGFSICLSFRKYLRELNTFFIAAFTKLPISSLFSFFSFSTFLLFFSPKKKKDFYFLNFFIEKSTEYNGVNSRKTAQKEGGRKTRARSPASLGKAFAKQLSGSKKLGL